MKVPSRPWTPRERDLLRREYADTATRALADRLGRTYASVAQQALRLSLKKSAAFLASPPAGGWGGSRSGARRFAPGYAPWNKGKPFNAGGRSATTHFKPGSRPKNELPIGSHRLRPDGYLEQKVSDQPGRHAQRWIPVHRLVWEAAHGPLAPGFVVVFKPGRRSASREDITVEALEIVSRAELMARNSLHNLPPELVDVIRLSGRLTRQINQRSKP